ncbi:type II secretion system protein M [Bacillus luteolus]|uniref:Type II secretion system protein M n=1 Tax=Litchfieldia luteola TaxID=682179 RepID=A0ABR9QI24_9BACI|nr:type II secretion system protein M [Cytobacillus luteolus]MBE4908148.1 type II secretion system protein M [Cytobacillus luteolus]MBP1942933.1 type IV pilus assembly protein PilO [Cytobacillus luteolus]
MAKQLSKKQLVIILMSSLLILLLFVFLYFLLIKPLETEHDRLENDLKTEKQLLEVVQTRVAQMQNQTYESTIELQKRVPVKPILEQFLLDLEKAEVVSNSFISNMSFGETEVTPQNTLEEYVDMNNNDETAEEAQEQENAQFPAGLEKITVNLSVVAPDYFALEEFITTLESQKRITQIENLVFAGTEEITSIEQEINPIPFTLTVSTFYLPSLTDLVDDLPTLETPLPSNKRNPFPTGIKDND